MSSVAITGPMYLTQNRGVKHSWTAWPKESLKSYNCSLHDQYYAVTANHVTDGFVKKVVNDPPAHFQINGLVFNPLKRIAFQDSVNDLVVLSIDPREVCDIGHRPYRPSYGLLRRQLRERLCNSRDLLRPYHAKAVSTELLVRSRISRST